MIREGKAPKPEEGEVMPILARPTSNLEKLQYIIGNGILRPDLRYTTFIKQKFEYITVGMRFTVRFVNSSHRTHQNLHTLVDGSCCHSVLDASLHLKRLLLNVVVPYHKACISCTTSQHASQFSIE